MHFLQESLIILREMNLRTTVILSCMKRIYKNRYKMFLVSPEGGTRHNQFNLQQI